MPSRHFAVIGPFPPYRGGIQHFSVSTRRTLATRGHRTSAVSFRRQYPALLFPGKTQFDTETPRETAGAPRLLDTVNPISWARTARYLARQRPDAVVIQYWMPFFAPALGTVARALRRRGIRVLAVVHNALPHERRPGDRALSRYFLSACDGLVVLSQSVREDVEGLGVTAPLQQVRHPVYDVFGPAVPRKEARTALGLPPEAPTLLFFGFIRRYKGLHVLLDAMPAVLEALPDAQLVVAGEFYADEEQYRNHVQQLGLGDAVRFDADYIPSPDVGRYFGAADVVVQPYVSATQSGVVQIAYHFGRPVITTDVGGLAETVPHERAGLVVPPNDPAALAEAVVRFFRERLAERLEAGVRAERVHYEWDRLGEALEALAEPQPDGSGA